MCVCVCSAAQTCTLSVKNLKFDSATCGSTNYAKTSADAKLGVGQKCQYVCETGSAKEAEMQCKAKADKTKAEGIWDAGCAGARFYFGVVSCGQVGRHELVFTGEWYSILAMHSIFCNDFPTVFCSTNV